MALVLIDARTLGRRRFVIGSMATAGAALLGGCGTSPGPAAGPGTREVATAY